MRSEPHPPRVARALSSANGVSDAAGLPDAPDLGPPPAFSPPAMVATIIAFRSSTTYQAESALKQDLHTLNVYFQEEHT